MSNPKVAVLSGSTLFELARKAYERLETDPSESIAALVFAAMSIESFLNDMVEIAARFSAVNHRFEEIRAFASLLSDLEQQKAQMGLKVQTAYYIFQKAQLDKGALPYQDFDLLLDIRHAMVHSKPEKVDWPTDVTDEFKPHKYVKRLADRGVIPLPSPKAPPQWKTLISRPEVARWSCNVAAQMVSFLIDLVPSGDFKQLLTVSATGIEEIR